ncbi:unnamed protein product [Mycena citricolor]|uniref:F-box domain-containing protein n=1 Tax=Mycena citricolor TaxID=2018698 RepID=A0AAD2JZU2_9AGAR|nr:unnamed protein product [Mycena citricolor]
MPRLVQRNVPPPILSIPSELTVNILSRIMRDPHWAHSDYQLQTFMLTCKAWAALVRDTPAMWCTIFSASSPSRAFLRAHIERSAQLPLHVRIGDFDSPFDLSPILSVAERVQSLELEGPSRDMNVLVEEICAPENHGRFGALRMLRLECRVYEAPPDVSARPARIPDAFVVRLGCLRSLRLRRIFVCPVGLSELQELHLDRASYPRWSFASLLDVLRACPDLTSLLLFATLDNRATARLSADRDSGSVPLSKLAKLMIYEACDQCAGLLTLLRIPLKTRLQLHPVLLRTASQAEAVLKPIRDHIITSVNEQRPEMLMITTLNESRFHKCSFSLISPKFSLTSGRESSPDSPVFAIDGYGESAGQMHEVSQAVLNAIPLVTVSELEARAADLPPMVWDSIVSALPALKIVRLAADDTGAGVCAALRSCLPQMGVREIQVCVPLDLEPYVVRRPWNGPTSWVQALTGLLTACRDNGSCLACLKLDAVTLNGLAESERGELKELVGEFGELVLVDET